MTKWEHFFDDFLIKKYQLMFQKGCELQSTKKFIHKK